jgi:hypothetical protein
MGGHSRPNEGETNEWWTPPEVFDALTNGAREALARRLEADGWDLDDARDQARKSVERFEFDLDPCAPPGGVPWVPAKRSLSIEDDGLTVPWTGKVWLNPPYGPHTGTWLRRLSQHGEGIALVFARTETAWFQEVAPLADRICFVAGRFFFVRPDGQRAKHNAGAPSAMFAFGERCAAALTHSGLGLVWRDPGAELEDRHVQRLLL